MQMNDENLKLELMIDDAGLKLNQTAIIKLYQYLKLIINELNPNMIHLTSSSGSSVVLRLNDSSYPFVYQYYCGKETYEYIIQMQKKINRHQLDLKKNITMMINYFPEFQTIVWERIKPLHELSIEILKTQTNQIIKQIGQAIKKLHLTGYEHGDCRYDNIGIKNGNFVLFDYNLSRPYDQQSNNENDYELLYKSLKFIFGKTGNLHSYSIYRSFLNAEISKNT